jgi:hypothetical protein
MNRSNHIDDKAKALWLAITKVPGIIRMGSKSGKDLTQEDINKAFQKLKR